MSFLRGFNKGSLVRDRKRDAANSPQVEETGGLCSPFAGHIVCCWYHCDTRITLHHVGVYTMLTVRGPRASAQLGHYQRRRENARTERHSASYLRVRLTVSAPRWSGGAHRGAWARSRYAGPH